MKDSSGNIVEDKIYTAGDSKDIYTYTQVGTKLYTAGTKFKVLAYSMLAEKVYRAGSNVTIPGYAEYGTQVYTAGTPVKRTNYTESTDYYESAGTTSLYAGDGTAGYLRGNQTSTEYYYINAVMGKNYGKMSKTSTNLYLGNGSYIYGRGTKKTCYLRKENHATGVFVKGSSTTITPIGSCVNPPQGTKLFVRDTSKDTTVTPIGAEFKNVYERDEDGDYDVTPVLRERTGLYERSEDYTTVRIVGDECTLELAEVTTQKSIVLGRPGGGPVITE